MNLLIKSVFFVIITAGIIEAAIISDYRMDECKWNGSAEEVVDQTGSYNAKVDIAGSTDTVKTGRINRAGVFNENGVINSAVAIPETVLNGRSEFTFTTWVYITDSDVNSKNTFLSAERSDTSDSDEILFRVYKGKIKLVYNGHQYTFDNLNSSLLFSGQWTFIGLTLGNTGNGNEACVFLNDGDINNQKYQCAPLTGNTTLNIKHLVLAQDRAGNKTDNYYPEGDLVGKMDEVKFFSAPKQYGELQSIYLKEQAGKYYDGSLSVPVVCIPKPQINYHMDECYWLNNSGTPKDVKDSTANGYDASSSNSAAIVTNTVSPPLCNYGSFSAKPDLVLTEDTTAGNTNEGFSTSFWIKADQDFEKWAVVLTKTKSYFWDDGWGFVNPTGSGKTLRFFINGYSGTHINTTIDSNDGWVHVVGTYDKVTLRLYINGVEIGAESTTESINNSGDSMRMGWDNDNDGEFIGALDEVKFWDQALTASDVSDIYNNEKDGKDYKGQLRICPSCEASIAAHTWEYVGIPAELRGHSYTIADVFGNNISNKYEKDWRVYERSYSDTNNSSKYKFLTSKNEVLTFGKGYLLGSSNTETWNVNNILSVDYNATNSACTTQRCVEIDIRSVSSDGSDGTGPYRYNLSGFTGKVPVDWSDCRFIVDSTVYTPSAAEAAGYVSKSIWKYNPNSGNDYTTCDDTTPGGCKLEPYKAFWIEVHATTLGKTVKLLIPKE